jgi:hypothetical protein
MRDRLQAIRQADGYYSDIGRDVRLDRRDPSIEDLPQTQVYFEDSATSSSEGARQAIAQPLTVVAFAVIQSQSSEVLGEQLLADIQRAAEVDEVDTLGNLISGAQGGLVPSIFSITLPTAGSNVVAASITYAAPYIRKSGDPEIL